MLEVVITAVGPDRPGLVDELTGYLFSVDANVADSRMINLRGQFAVILLVQVPEGQLESFQHALLEHAQRMDLKLSVATQDGQLMSLRPGLPFRVRAFAMDQPGIVHRITHLLHQFGANIEELQTRLEPGSMTGTPLFTLDARITVPPSVQMKRLRTELTDLCDSLNCDVEVLPG